MGNSSSNEPVKRKSTSEDRNQQDHSHNSGASGVPTTTTTGQIVSVRHREQETLLDCEEIRQLRNIPKIPPLIYDGESQPQSQSQSQNQNVNQNQQNESLSTHSPQSHSNSTDETRQQSHSSQQTKKLKYVSSLGQPSLVWFKAANFRYTEFS